MQLNHYQNKFTRKEFPIVIVCDQVTSPANVGAVFRAADAFGVAKVFFCGAIPPDFSKRTLKVSRNAQQWIPYEQVHDIEEVAARLSEEGYTLCAVEITEDSIPLAEINLTEGTKLALVIGAENYGISESILAKAAMVTHIPMYGNNSSMNVAQALTLALYEFTNKLLKL